MCDVCIGVCVCTFYHCTDVLIADGRKFFNMLLYVEVCSDADGGLYCDTVCVYMSCLTVTLVYMVCWRLKAMCGEWCVSDGECWQPSDTIERIYIYYLYVNDEAIYI